MEATGISHGGHSCRLPRPPPRTACCFWAPSQGYNTAPGSSSPSSEHGLPVSPASDHTCLGTHQGLLCLCPLLSEEATADLKALLGLSRCCSLLPTVPTDTIQEQVLVSPSLHRPPPHDKVGTWSRDTGLALGSAVPKVTTFPLSTLSQALVFHNPEER